MAELKELKKIKKIYGENFMKLCRELFPTILEEKGKLEKILLASFSKNSKTLYEDITNNNLKERFKAYVYNQFYIEKMNDDSIAEKEPYEILNEVGYELTECKTEDEIQEFKKWYIPEEKLCTFRGGRLDRCIVFFAVKNNAEDIKRENFKEPERDDEYGTSVVSIQFTKGEMCTVSIKNRYNHTVENPDATLGNDLNRIAPGLTNSFSKLLKREYGLELNNKDVEKFEIPGYIIANDGKYYKYNFELNGIYYCPGNVIIENGKACKLENPESEILIDCFVLDTKNKTLKKYDPKVNDSFADAFKDLSDARIQVEKGDKKGSRIITIQKEQESPIVIEIDKNNQITSYENKEVRRIGDNFLHKNKSLTNLELLNLKYAEKNFLYNNKCLEKIILPSLEKVETRFLCNNKKLKEINLPKLEKTESYFLYDNEKIEKVDAPSLKQAGVGFLYNNKEITRLDLPELEQTEKNFLYNNKKINELNLPNLKQVGDNFLCKNQKLTSIKAPMLKNVGSNFLSNNEIIDEIELPKLEDIKNYFLYSNQNLTKLELQNAKRIEDYFLYNNQKINEINLPKVEKIQNYFLNDNKELTKLKLPSLEQIENRFLYENIKLKEVELPNLKVVQNEFLKSNKELQKLELLSIENVGDSFLYSNEKLKEFNAPNLEQVGWTFLYENKELTQLDLPKLKEVGMAFLSKNQQLTKLKVPNLKKAGIGFLEDNIKLIELYAPMDEEIREKFSERIAWNKKMLKLKNISKLDKKSELTTTEVNSAKKIIEEDILQNDKENNVEKSE